MSRMEEDDDVVMCDTPPSTVIPIGSRRPLSPSAEKPPSPLELNGTTAPAPEPPATVEAHAPHSPRGNAPSLMQLFLQKFSTQLDKTATNQSENKSQHDLKYDLDDDSLVEDDSDWPNDNVEATRGLPLASLATGLCYDIRMRYHCEVKPTLDVHPEDPRRIYYIYKELCKAGLVDDPESSRPLVPQPLQRIDAREATEEEISLVHDAEHYDFVQSTKFMLEEELIALEHTRDSIYFNSLTFTSAVLSCGGAIETCMAVVDRQVKNAIAVIRPPGHHAERNKTMGFCLFNNVCVAAKVCQKEFGDKCRKILILDWDVHHGNGIQKAFYDDPNILYISIHVYRDGSFYPGGEGGNWDRCGAGSGLGKNINIPWPTQGMGDGDYMYAFQEVVMPIAYEFDPDLVIISAGFDAAAGDELGGCFVTPPCYAHMTRMLMNLAGGKVAVCLEGGYNFRSISKSALAVTRTLMGEPPDRLYASSASRQAVNTVKRVAMIQSAYWNCMYPKDIIRQYQAKQLYDSCKLTSLFIYRDTISKSFEHQVLARPELMGIPHPVTNVLEPHNCWLADVVKGYVEWAIQNNIGVIDVNIPKHLTPSEKSVNYQDEDRMRMQMSDQLATYLWENYIECVSALLCTGIRSLLTSCKLIKISHSPLKLVYNRPNDATSIFFLGVGNAYFGLANLLRVHQRVSGVISFVAESPVRAVSSNTTTWLSKWYKENSLVFVSHLHGVWAGPENSRKLSKRYGRLIPSMNVGLNEMLNAHKEDVIKFITDRLEEDEEDDEAGGDS
ncbi:histone deacetylase hda1 [Histoplasma capsulatum H143]|uniref:Histone deacetylase n=1 Tax=Ajellomyces capsulatus (strain H143) TaxID=544712 RepID=C6H3C8_AJECH|nr:histone deacetylase hda1 [Histoplasma capsulatum H143]